MDSSFAAGGVVVNGDHAKRTATALWDAVDRLIDRATLDGILAHKLGPLAAIRWRSVGRPVPDVLAEQARAASFSMLSAVPLLRRILDVWGRPLVVLKGPELASLYPRNGRRFSDVDVLTPDAKALHRALKLDGFVEVPEADFDHADHHHLVPLRWPVSALTVEVHALPNWPAGLQPPPLESILEAAVPSVLAIDGLLAPNPIHHALMLAAHGWSHEPLQTLRDLLDVAAAATGRDAGELHRTARAWEIGRIWRTTQSAIEALFFGGPRTLALRVWARHLEPVHERTVFESHLQRWLRAFWGLPLRAALAETGRVLRVEVAPAEGETWGDKLARIPKAVRDAGVALSDRHAASTRRR